MSSALKKASFSSKILVLGKSGVGKSYLLLQYTTKNPNNLVMSTTTTLEVDFKSSIENVDGTEVKMQIWDTAGQEKFRPIIQTYFKNSKAAIFVFDLTDKQSLEDIKYWLREVKVQCGKKVIKMLVGNKCDLEHEEPDQSLIQDYCEENDMEYIKTSALQKINIKELFQKLARKLYEQHQLIQSTISQTQIVNSVISPQNNPKLQSSQPIILKSNKKTQPKETCC